MTAKTHTQRNPEKATRPSRGFFNFYKMDSLFTSHKKLSKIAKKCLKCAANCDRILFKHNNNIVPIEYASLQKGFEYSDHRPVYGIYEVNIMEEIQNLKNQLEDKIKLHFDLNISSQYLLNKYK